jgi:D-alanyl-D-alanine carboxypeptidase/D-alanyl-D-alanine-endopeptidase (penicillin-binding protein 4)
MINCFDLWSKLVLVFTTILLVLPSFAQNTPLQTKINELANDSFYKHANLGISVRSLSSGVLIGELEKDKMLTPASTMKLLTTLAALEILGEDFKFETRVTYDGLIENDGTLKGNVYIEGGGDPSLGSDRIQGCKSQSQLIEKIVQDITAAGITCVDGDIIGDHSFYQSFPIPASWQWNDLGNYYAAGAWGLNINENEYYINFNRSGKVGQKTELANAYPFIPFLILNNEVTVGEVGSGDNAYIYGGPGQYNKTIYGTIPYGKSQFKIKGAIPEPPLYFAFQVFKQLGKYDMGGQKYLMQTKLDPNQSQRKLISKLYSPSLEVLVKYANLKSINIYCESFLKAISKTISLEDSYAKGIESIDKYLKLKDLETRGLHMEDGSGLSARNLMSPDFLTTFLNRITNVNEIENKIKLLAKAGEDGTVKNILKKSKAKGNLWMKSGSMDKILTYAGYCKSESGNWVSFSIFLNASTAKKNNENKIELEKILEAIYRFS